MKSHKKWFTLVELVVVMIIIVILSLVSFLYSKNSTINARNANRITDIWTLQNSLELNHSKNWKYLLPDEPVSIYYKDATNDPVSYQWIFWDLAKIAFKYKHTKVDPLDKIAYNYSVSADSDNYQIISFMEKNKNNKIIAPTAWAVDSLSNREVKLYGNPVWIFVNKTTSAPINLDNSVNSIDINDVSAISSTLWLYLDDEDNIITPESNKILKASPNTSCSRLLELWKKVSWKYKILDATNDIKRETYCDMSNGNGGWTTVWKGDNHNYNSSSYTYIITPEELKATKMMIGYINSANRLSSYYYFDIPEALKLNHPMASSSNTVNLAKAMSGDTGIDYTTNVQFSYGNGTWWKMAITWDSITDAPSYTGFNSSSLDSCWIASNTVINCNWDKNFIILVK